MELRVLKYFLVTAQEENITRAAEHLHITQPTLSRQLQQLEEELGTELFHRSSHCIKLTEEGMLLKRRAQEIVALADKTEQEFRHTEENIAGEITIGSGETKGMYELAEVLSAFQRQYPAVTYDFYTATADVIKEKLDKGLFDLGLVTEPVDISRYNFVRMQEKEEWGILIREDSALAEKDCVRPEDLLEVPVFLIKRAPVQNELSGWFGQYYDRIRIAGTYNLTNNIAVMVAKGMGAAVCFRPGANYDGLRFVPLSPRLESRAAIIWKKSQPSSPALLKLTEFIRKEKISYQEK